MEIGIIPYFLLFTVILTAIAVTKMLHDGVYRPCYGPRNTHISVPVSTKHGKIVGIVPEYGECAL